MASFVASYNGPTGQERTLTIKAADPTEARKLLRRRGIRATALKPAGNKGNASTGSSEQPKAGMLSMDLSRLFEKPPGVKEKAIFASKLAALVDAGVPIVRSLDLMARQQKLPMFKRALTKVSLDVNEGIALGTALAISETQFGWNLRMAGGLAAIIMLILFKPVLQKTL